MDAAGATFSFAQTQAEAADSTNCTVTVPARPLSAKGLATPWELGDGCTWANGGTEGVFIDATILAPNGQLQMYNPLVIDQGTTPDVAPTPPTIAAGSQVILSVGYNGNALALVARARAGQLRRRVRQLAGRPDAAVQRGQFLPDGQRRDQARTAEDPAAGTGQDGQACPTTRDFGLIDQDQSDNAVASYLFDPATGQSAQATAANQAAMANATLETNGSDNGLLDKFVDPALGYRPSPRQPHQPASWSSSQALNELSARANQKGTIALLPVNNPQLLVGGRFSLGKTNVYRAETDMPLLPRNTNLDRNAGRYCQDMINIAAPRLKLDAPMETGTRSPVPDLGDNLATFLAARLSGSFGNLNCKNYGLTDPVTLTTDANGMAIAATFNTTPQKASINTVGGNGGRHHRGAAVTTGGPTSCRASRGHV